MPIVIQDQIGLYLSEYETVLSDLPSWTIDDQLSEEDNLCELEQILYELETLSVKVSSINEKIEHSLDDYASHIKKISATERAAAEAAYTNFRQRVKLSLS
jgi:hypothetical protein